MRSTTIQAVGVFLLLVASASCSLDDIRYETRLSAPGSLEVTRNPPAANFAVLRGQGKLSALPAYDADSGALWQVDLRSYDLSALDLSGRESDLLQADFDSVTRWPATLPEGFEPNRIMELGKNPGLGVRDLHASGITGKGVGIGIIDQALLTNHVEYADRLRLYEEIHWVANSPAQMHGPAVASIALGKTLGVAPEADLYFIAEWNGVLRPDGGVDFDLSPLAQAVDRMVVINAELAEDRKLRIISISLGINPNMGNYRLAMDAISRAESQGIHVVYVGSSDYMGMGRQPLADPDAVVSYGPGAFWAPRAEEVVGRLMVPMDSRATASPTGPSDYAFYRQGGVSWATPYLAGLYALAYQAAPGVTWEQFWSAAVDTAVTTSGAENGTGRDFGRIVAHAALIETIRARNVTE